MGEMTIKVDDALLVEASARAEHMGVSLDAFVASAMADALRDAAGTRLPVSRKILARGGPMSPISSVELLDQIRDGAE